MKRTFDNCLVKNRVELLMLLVLSGAGTCLGGCTSLGPKPWQHDLMAEPAMRINSDPLQAAVDDHIYFSKEGSSGGRSYAGGGCGCN